MSQFDAFAAFNQRKSGLAQWEDEDDKTLNRMLFMKKYAKDGYDSTRFGVDSENQKAWDSWLAENKDDYTYIERIMGSNVPSRFAGTSSSSSDALSGSGRFKDGFAPADAAGTFDGTGSDASSALYGKGLKHDPMSPAAKYGRRRRNVDPFSPFGMPDIDKFK